MPTVVLLSLQGIRVVFVVIAARCGWWLSIELGRVVFLGASAPSVSANPTKKSPGYRIVRHPGLFCYFSTCGSKSQISLPSILAYSSSLRDKSPRVDAAQISHTEKLQGTEYAGKTSYHWGILIREEITVGIF